LLEPTQECWKEKEERADTQRTHSFGEEMAAAAAAAGAFLLDCFLEERVGGAMVGARNQFLTGEMGTGCGLDRIVS